MLQSWPEPVAADAGNCTVSSAPLSAPTATEPPPCTEVYSEHLYSSETSPWKIGFGAGYGERSNPLINSDDIPIYGIIQLSYFSEHFFFDNGDLGWFITAGSNWSIQAIAGVGGERSFYSFLNSSAIGFSPTSGVDFSAPNQPEPGDGGQDPSSPGESATIKVEAPDRALTVDGGLELIYSRGKSEFQLQLLTDISGQHYGEELWFSWARVHQKGPWEIVPSRPRRR